MVSCSTSNTATRLASSTLCSRPTATAADGTVSFDVTMADTGVSGGVRVTIGMMSAPNGIHDTVTLTYADPADVLATDYYGGYIQYDLTKFVEAWGFDPRDGVCVRPGRAHPRME